MKAPQHVVDLAVWFEKHTPGARWVKLVRYGADRATIGVRYPDRSRSDSEVEDREYFLAKLHADVYGVRFERADKDGETYYVVVNLRQPVLPGME